jgi:type IV pilus assembly protein PilQ
VPWDQALDIILRANKLGYSVDGTIVRIAPNTVLKRKRTSARRCSTRRTMQASSARCSGS